MNKKKQKMEVTYTYIEPRTPQEAEEAHRRLASAYDVVFKEVIRRRHALGYTGRIGHIPPGGRKNPPHSSEHI